MNKNTINQIVGALSEVQICLNTSFVQMQREMIGFCVGQNKINHLFSICRALGDDFDLVSQQKNIESKFLSLKKDEVLAREEAESYSVPTIQMINSLETSIASLNIVIKGQEEILRLEKAHNLSAKKYKLSKSGVAKINAAGKISWLTSKELRSANKIIDLVRSKYDVDYIKFREMVTLANEKLGDLTHSLASKKRIIHDYDKAVDVFRVKSEEVSNYNINETFGKLLEKAFNDDRFIHLFLKMFGDAGAGVVDAVFKNRLLTAIANEAVESANSLASTPYDLGHKQNADVLLARINQPLEVFKLIESSFVRCRYLAGMNAKESFTQYLKECEHVSGVTLSLYKSIVGCPVRLKLDSDGLLGSSHAEPVVEAVLEQEKVGLFNRILGKKATKRTGVSLEG